MLSRTRRLHTIDLFLGVYRYRVHLAVTRVALWVVPSSVALTLALTRTTVHRMASAFLSVRGSVVVLTPNT